MLSEGRMSLHDRTRPGFFRRWADILLFSTCLLAGLWIFGMALGRAWLLSFSVSCTAEINRSHPACAAVTQQLWAGFVLGTLGAMGLFAALATWIGARLRLRPRAAVRALRRRGV